MTTQHAHPDLCEHTGGVSRRGLLRGGAALGGATVVTQLFGDSMMQASFAGNRGGNTLVVLSLRGGIDGLGVVVPHGDPGYYAARPSTAIAANRLLCKDGMFGLHPKLSALQPFWQSGELAAIQAVGLPVPNRSHFAAMEAIEDAAPGSDSRTGWINRMVGMGQSNSPVDAVQLGVGFPTAAMQGPSPVLAASRLGDLRLRGTDSGWDSARYASLTNRWRGNDSLLARSVREAVDVSRTVAGPVSAAGNGTVAYPTSWDARPFVDSLQSAARLIRADLGTDVIAIDAGSWDIHAAYGTTEYGPMQAALGGLGDSLAAFLADLGPLRQRVTVATISEFGRRVAENGSRGFDHGWGNMMLVAGAGVRGGRYYGSWPRLDSSALVEGDLKVTTDYRNVLAEIVTRRFPDRSLAHLFPGLSYLPLSFMAA